MRTPDKAPIGVEEAWQRVVSLAAAVPGTEDVGLHAAAGRVLRAAVHSDTDLPPFHSAAMDGYGLAEAVTDAMLPATLRLVGHAAAGDTTLTPPRRGEAIRVLTGAPLPDGIGAVQVEEACIASGEAVTCMKPVAPGANIRRRGEDVAKGALALSPPLRLDMRHVALAAAVGAARLTVTRPIRLAVLSTGNELVEPGSPLSDGRIRDGNRPMLLGLFDRPGIAAADLGLVPDDDQSLADALQGALRDGADLVVSTGGASGSEADRLLPALGSIGASAEKLRIAQRPGKPMVIGRMGTVPIVGLPGNPLAALVGAVFFVLPLLDALAGLPARRAVGRIVRLADGFARKPGRTEWLPARLEEAADGTTTAHPLTPFGSARLRLLAEAEGLVEIPPGDAAPRWHAPWSCRR